MVLKELADGLLPAVKVLRHQNGQVAEVLLCRGIFMQLTNKKKRIHRYFKSSVT